LFLFWKATTPLEFQPIESLIDSDVVLEVEGSDGGNFSIGVRVDKSSRLKDVIRNSAPIDQV
jgi:hypothetical protein